MKKSQFDRRRSKKKPVTIRPVSLTSPEALLDDLIAKELLKDRPFEITPIDEVDMEDKELVDMGRIFEVFGNVKWSWIHRFPIGYTIMIVGEPGVGKTFLEAYLISVFTGASSNWPNGKPYTGPVGNVIVIDTENMRGELVVRLKKLGVTKNSSVTFPIKNNDPFYIVDLQEDLNWITNLARDNGTVAIFLDSLVGGHQQDENKTAMVKVLQPLSTMAAKLNIPVFIVHDITKDPKQNFRKVIRLKDIRGSGTMSKFVRSIFSVCLTSEDGDAPRNVECIKHNFAPPSKGFAFNISKDGISFVDKPKPVVGELFVTDEAIDFLKETLQGQPLVSTTILELGKAKGLSRWTIYEAKKRLDITMAKGVWTLRSPKEKSIRLG
jgi:hypothetical protein